MDHIQDGLMLTCLQSLDVRDWVRCMGRSMPYCNMTRRPGYQTAHVYDASNPDDYIRD